MSIDSVQSIHDIEMSRKLIESEYFFGNKPDMKNKLPNIRFSRYPGRKDNYKMYSRLDGSHETLFPRMLSKNKSVVGSVEFHRIPGRAEHLQNLARRKVQKP